MAADERAACFISPEPEEDGAPPTPVRVCVIDLGTNSFHAVIVDAHPNRTFERVDKMKIMVRLGQRGLADHRLPEDAMQRGYEALERIMQLASGWQASEYLAFATSAIREATNGGDFIRRVQKGLGLRIRPISGSQEADLIYQGVRQVVSLAKPSLIVDVGGGSTEFIVGTSEAESFSASLKLGAARMTERFVTTDPISKKEKQALRAHYREALRPILEAARAQGVRTLVGSSGTMECLAQVSVNRYGDEARTIFQQDMAPADLKKAARFLIGTTEAERQDASGVDQRRVEQIVAGAVLLEVLLEELSFDTVRISPYALREGMVMYFIEQNYARIRHLAAFSDVRRRAVYELGYRFHWEEEHARHVARLALLLFDATRPLHGLGPASRELLEYAALLHDIGYHISHRRHHKHSRYLILNTDLHGFRPQEVQVMAFVARYHRRSLPKKKHGSFQRLPSRLKKRIVQLAALLRLAESLDRSHFQNVTGLRTTLTDEQFTIHIETKGDPQLEAWATERSSELFENVFDRQVAVEAETAETLSKEAGAAAAAA